mmetsp:Transcript_11039/g.29170  ORF Transcript_11039/g.29170 Transcript_11039/m.29170 type:complete len:367 (+) Transcript_11039:72-1172(+)
MTTSSFIAHVLDPLVEVRYAAQEAAYEKAFSAFADDQRSRGFVPACRRLHTYALDWAGDKLLVSTKENKLLLYDVERGEEERFWSGEWMSAQCSPNEPHIAAAVSWAGKFRVFDTRSSSQTVFDADLKRTSSSMKEFLCLSWAPDAKHIAVANRSDQVYLLDLRGSLRLGASKHMQHEVNQLAWSKEGDTLWIATGGGGSGRIQVFPTPSLSNENAAGFVAHQSMTISLAVDPMGKYIASGGGDCLVTLWDPRHLVCVRTFGFPAQPVTSLGFNQNGTLLAWGTGSGSIGGEKNLTFVGADTGTLYWQEATAAPVQQLKWHPTRSIIAYTLNVQQLGDDRDGRGPRGRSEGSVLRTLRVPEVPLSN